MSDWSDADLLAFLDESLPADTMAAIEDACRDNQELLRRLAAVRGREDAGLHTIGAIWRRHRLSCPERQQLGQYLLGVLDDDSAAYVRFHIERIGCRRCQANLSDLQSRQQDAAGSAEVRRTRYFQTSAGYLRKRS
ncbi:hypothetical protein [Roseimaritima sediminicola]|uniref:hypothetical protein n=1 Tax=Roseimaritima sediminicola TaxID=2662066 RepID=UPI0012984294|nr:hypothetical protein [Roseimaritima sediminicola]